jgi:hypothetical protein
MLDATTIQYLPVETGPRSSVFEKTTPDLRRKLDRAIVNYDPPGYLALFKKFGLTELGVSYQAFYNYARKLRRRAAARETIQASLADEQQVVKSLPALLGQFLIDQIMGNDQAAPSAIYRLMLAYTAALKNVVLVQEKGYIFAPRPPAPSEPRPSASGDRGNALPSQISSLDNISPKDLLTLTERVVAARQAHVDEDWAVAQAEFEEMKKKWVALGYPVQDARTHDEVDAIIARADAEAAAIPTAAAADMEAARSEPRPSESGDPAAPHSPFHIPTSAIEHDPPDRRIPTRDHLPDPDPRREALRQRLRENFKPLMNLDST